MSNRLQPAQLALFAVVFVLILVLFGAIRNYVYGQDISSLVYEALFIVAIVTIGFLRVFTPTLRQVIDKGVVYYFLFMIIYVATFAPGMAYFIAARWVSQEGGSIVNTIFFAFSGVLWLGFVAVLFPSSVRTRIFD